MNYFDIDSEPSLNRFFYPDNRTFCCNIPTLVMFTLFLKITNVIALIEMPFSFRISYLFGI